MKTFRQLKMSLPTFSPVLIFVVTLQFLQSVTPTLGDLSSYNTQPFKRFEYTFSFKGPYLSQPDGSIPFWERRGNALPHDSNIRITPSLRNQRGAVWTKNKTYFETGWEVELDFRITGRGKIGGDGMAFWFVEEKPGYTATGEVFGGFQGPWKGLAIFWDSYDNDGNFNNPALVAINNDGTKLYDHDTDGQTQKFAFYKKDYRNPLFYSRARITYHRDILNVYMTNGRTKDTIESDFEPCFLAYGLNLTSSGYFGVSAATGQVFADDHDVSKFLTYSLHNSSKPSHPQGQGQGQNQGQVDQVDTTEADELAEKYEKELQEWIEKLERQKEEYKKEHENDETNHTSHHKEEEHNPEDEFDPDDEYLKEIRTIFEQQSHAREDIAHVSKLVDQVFGKHESLTSAMVRFHHGLPTEGEIKLSGAVPSATSQNLQRFEVENLLTANRELLSITAEIKNLATRMEHKLANQNKPHAEFPGILSNTEEIEQATREIHSLQSGVKLIVAKISEQGGFADCWTGWCISTKSFVFFNVLSTLLLLGALIYRDNNYGQGPAPLSSTSTNKARFY